MDLKFLEYTFVGEEGTILFVIKYRNKFITICANRRYGKASSILGPYEDEKMIKSRYRDLKPLTSDIISKYDEEYSLSKNGLIEKQNILDEQIDYIEKKAMNLF